MKWYNAAKKKPRGGERVLICPSGVSPIGYWDAEKQKWYYYSSPYTYSPISPYHGVTHWAHINYPTSRFDFVANNLFRRKWSLKWLILKRKISSMFTPVTGNSEKTKGPKT